MVADATLFIERRGTLHPDAMAGSFVSIMRAFLSVKREKASAADKKESAVNVFSCGKCGSYDLRIAFGRSYYLECNDYGGNPPIKLTCKKYSGQMRTRKQKDTYYSLCNKCDIDL